MLKYFKSSRPKNSYDLLSNYGLLGKKFKDLPLTDFKKDLKYLVGSSKAKVQELLKIFLKAKATPEILLQ